MATLLHILILAISFNLKRSTGWYKMNQLKSLSIYYVITKLHHIYVTSTRGKII